MKHATPNPTLGELYDAGAVETADEARLLQNLFAVSDATEERLASVPFGALGVARKGGRPVKGAHTERTTTKTFRFTFGFIRFLELQAKRANLNATRYVEAAVLLKSAIDNQRLVQLYAYRPKPQRASTLQAASYTSSEPTCEAQIMDLQVA